MTGTHQGAYQVLILQMSLSGRNTQLSLFENMPVFLGHTFIIMT